MMGEIFHHLGEDNTGSEGSDHHHVCPYPHETSWILLLLLVFGKVVALIQSINKINTYYFHF